MNGQRKPTPPSPLPPGEGGTSKDTIFLWVAITVLAFALPLVGHGCHGDDVDHEPTVMPPVRTTPTSSNSR